MNLYKTESKIFVLPSDGSSAYYPNNISSKFTIKLPETQNFDDSFEVGLLEFIYPNSVRNIPNETFFKIITKLNDEKFEMTKLLIDPGVYTEERLLNKIKDHLNNLNLDELKQSVIKISAKKYDLKNIIIDKPSIRINKFTNKIELKYGQISFTRENQLYKFELYLEFDDYLHKMLGFRENSKTSDQMQADNLIDIFGQVHIIYIYSDVVSPIIVGSERLSLLQMFTLHHPNETSLMPASLNRITFQSPVYVPLSRKTFDTIEIVLRDDSGQLIQFETGKTLATLHFRRISK